MFQVSSMESIDAAFKNYEQDEKNWHVLFLLHEHCSELSYQCRRIINVSFLHHINQDISQNLFVKPVSKRSALFYRLPSFFYRRDHSHGIV